MVKIVTHNLSVQLTQFIGRQRSIVSSDDLISRSRWRREERLLQPQRQIALVTAGHAAQCARVFGKYDWVAIIVHAMVRLPSLIFVLAVILGLLQRLDGSFSSACDRRLAPRKCVVWHRDTGYQADKIAQALVRHLDA